MNSGKRFYQTRLRVSKPIALVTGDRSADALQRLVHLFALETTTQQRLTPAMAGSAYGSLILGKPLQIKWTAETDPG